MIMVPDAYFLIVTVDKIYHIIVLIPRDFVCQSLIVSVLIWFFSFLLLFAVWVSLQLMQFNVIWGRRLRSFAVLLAARLPLQLGILDRNLSIWL